MEGVNEENERHEPPVRGGTRVPVALSFHPFTTEPDPEVKGVGSERVDKGRIKE